jgi:hypothetical protein
MAKVKVSAIRALHAHLGDMLAQFDAGQVAATGGASGDPEESDQPAAQDSAHRGASIRGIDRLQNNWINSIDRRVKGEE